MEDNNRFIILDGNNLAYRAFYALPLLQNSKGQYTNAIYGFMTMLLKLIKEEEPKYLAVAFDLPAPTFRHKLYAEYKAQRERAPEELREQMGLIKDALKAMGIQSIEVEGFEADDIIGTCCTRAAAQGIDSLIVTGDADVLQLISERTKVALVKKGITQLEHLDTAGLMTKLSLTPAQIIDYKALKGDPSDNIPGVPGIGDKTALKLLKEYGNVEEVLDNAAGVSGKRVKENLKLYREQALISKELATICTEVPFDFDLASYQRKTMNTAAISDLFTELEFNSLLDRLGVAAKKKETKALPHLPLKTLNEEDVPSLVARMKEARELIFSFVPAEKKGKTVSPMAPQGIAVHLGEEGAYIPFTKKRAKETFLTLAKEVFAAEDIKKVTAQAKDVYNDLAADNIFLKGLTFDICIAAYLLDPARKDFSLRVLGQELLNMGDSQEDELSVSASLMLLKELYEYLKVELAALDMDELFFNIELPLIQVLSSMERQGVKVDADILKKMVIETKKREDILRQEIYALAGEEFNVNSPKQLRVILFDKLKLPVLKKTKTGPSTDASVLEELAGAHQVVAKILLLRYQFKLRTTYLEGLLALLDPESGKIHTTFHQTVTATGRLSSAEPNLQNIPIRQEGGRLIRKAFIPSQAGWELLAVDYSQIELRLLAHLSEDESLCRAFWEGQDIHRITAAEVGHVPVEEVTGDMRSRAKAINFGIIYGMSDYGLSQNLNITRAEAKDFIEVYFSRYPGVKKYMNQVIQKAREEGFVTTLLKRRRYLPEINHKNFNLRSFAERMAVNTPIQGTAADVIKKSMVDVAGRLQKEGLRARMLLQVHDELVFEVPREEIEETALLLREAMENVISLKVPLTVDIKYGPNWLEMQPYKGGEGRDKRAGTPGS